MPSPTGRESDKFMLRLPEGMRDRIKAEGDKNGRSMNAEIVAALEDKFPAQTVWQMCEKEIFQKLGAMHEDERDEKMKAILDLLRCPGR